MTERHIIIVGAVVVVGLLLLGWFDHPVQFLDESVRSQP